MGLERFRFSLPGLAPFWVPSCFSVSGMLLPTPAWWVLLGIILLGHLVTIPTALAIAEIATNRKVEGGGEYFIISRSFGTTIGSVIGVSLYLSQAVSVAFYMIAFAEAFSPFFC